MPRTLADLTGTNLSVFRLGKPPTRATFDASGLTAPRGITVQDASGTLALMADVSAAQAAAIAYAIQRANHAGTQLAATISDFAAAALAATVSAYQPLNVNLTALASDYDGATKTLTHNISKAATSAGLALQANNGTLVVTLGPGGGAGAAFADGVTCASLTATGANGVATIQAATQDGIRLLGRAGGTSSYVGTVTVAALGASRTYTLPDASLTFAGQNIDNAFSLAQTFAGSVPGAPSSGQVAIGGGAVKAGGAISCNSLAAPIATLTRTGSASGLWACDISRTAADTVASGVYRALSLRHTDSSVTTDTHYNQSFFALLKIDSNANNSGYDRAFQAEIELAGNGTRSTATVFRLQAGTSGTSTGTIGLLQGLSIAHTIVGGSTVTESCMIDLGANVGTSKIALRTLSTSGIVSLGDTTDASAIGAAAHVVAGGGSYAKSLWVGATAGNYINIANGTGELRVNGTKVVAARKPGWTAQTASASRSDLGAAPTVGAIASFLRALYDDLAGHGLIGA